MRLVLMLCSMLTLRCLDVVFTFKRCMCYSFIPLNYFHISFPLFILNTENFYSIVIFFYKTPYSKRNKCDQRDGFSDFHQD